MTLALVLTMLVLVWLSGLGVMQLIFRTPDSIPRLLVCPFAGMAAAVLLFFFLLPLNMTGTQTGAFDMVLLGVLAALGVWKSPLRREDWREAMPVLLICSGGFLLAAWPLLASGYQDYLGYANPDVPSFISLMRYFSSHPVKLPDPRFFRGLGPGGMVGVLVYAYQTSALTAVSVEELFSTVCAVIVFLSPCSVYLLCRIGLGMTRRMCLVTASAGATSSLLAYTFYLHSLGTLTVMVTLPVAVGVAIHYFRNPDWRHAVLLGLLLSGSLYNYSAGFIVFAVVCGAVGAIAVWRPEFPRKRLVALGAACVAAIALPSFPYLKGILISMISLSAQSKLAATANELQTTFALVLTERGLPFFWGLAIPFASPPQWFGSGPTALALVLAVAALLFTIAAHSLSVRASGLTPGFRAALAAASALMVFFYGRGVGYGVFKLIAWTHFLFLAALAADVLNGFSKRRVVRIVLCSALLGYMCFNAALAIQLGRSSLGLGDSILSSMPSFTLRDFRALEALPPQTNALVGLADQVAREWVSPFLGHPEPRYTTLTEIYDSAFGFVGRQSLSVQDSQPMAFLPHCDDTEHADELRLAHLSCLDLASSSFLDWRQGRDLGGKAGTAEWVSRVFALQKGVPADTVILGRGWYRTELVPRSPFAWQRNPFRWLRKRAEVFVLNPSPAPKRLHLTMAAGFGYASEERHLELLLNGRHVETIFLAGFRDLITEPFEIPGPASQIELAVEEIADPIKRTLALWNRWVPADARHLNVAVSHLELIEGGAGSAHVPSEVDFGAQLGGWGTTTNGLFPDRWAGAGASIGLRVPPGTAYLDLRGFVPGVRAYSFPIHLDFFAGGEPLGSGRIDAPGQFRIRIPVSAAVAARLHGEATISLHPSATFQPSALRIGPDTRILSFQISYIGFGPQR